MHVIGHQAVGPDVRPGAPRRLREQIAVELIIAVFEEGLLAAVAALGHVVRQAGQNEARETDHGGQPMRARLISKLAP